MISGGGAFLVYSATFIIRKLIRSKEAAGCFLVKLVSLAIQKHACSIKAGGFSCNRKKCMFKTNERLLFSLVISITLLKYLYYEFYKNFRERCFLKLPRTAAFEFINYQLLIL